MIELNDISIANDPRHMLIEHQTLLLKEKTLTALIGRNGCGKSTLLRVICGQQKPTGGKVMINGMDVSKASVHDIASTIAIITTETAKISNLTCRELVGYGRTPYTGMLGRLSATDNVIIDEALQTVGMSSFANRKISHISDGESRRIMLARALAQQTPVIILDEPTSFLDVPGRFEIAALLARLAHEQDKTIFYSTHELEPAFRNADTMLLMRSAGLIALQPDEMRKSKAFTELFN